MKQATPSTRGIPIEEISTDGRVRKDMGNLRSLADSMARHGLLHPIVLQKDGMLIAGQRRIEAAKLLGWIHIPATTIEIADLLSAERDENTERKDFTPSEAVEIGRMIEEHERPLAAARKGRRGSGESPEAGEVREKASRAVGMGTQKYRQAKAVIAAAKSNPAKFGDLVEKMDATGNVHGAHKELERRETGKPKGPKRTGFRKNKTEPFKLETEHQRVAANAEKRRMVSSLSIISGHCRGLKGLDIPMALSVCDAEEVRTWSCKASELSRALRALSINLRKGNQ